MNFFTFNILEGSHTFQHLVEVHLMTVEFRTIHTYELRLSAHGDTTSTTHARTIHHNGVQRHISRNIIFLGQKADKFHHDGRTNGKTLVHLFTFDDCFYSFSNQTFLSVRTVVRHDNHFVRTLTHFLFKNNQFLGTSGQHGNDPVSRSLQCLHDRQHRSHTYTTSGTNHRSEVFNMSSLSQRTYHICNVITHIQFAQTSGRKSDFLHHQSNGSLHRIGCCNGQRHAFPLLAYTDNDKMSRLTRLCNQRSLKHQFEDLFEKMFLLKNPVHNSI